MPKITVTKDPDRLAHCPFPKWQGALWVDVLEEDPSYIEWLISGEGPKMDDELYNHLIELLEE
ncbi:MAG: hypothetical protein AB7V18_19225 [Pyrinomonadaceae bacterium]